MGDCFAPPLLFWVNLTTVVACALPEHTVLSPKLGFFKERGSDWQASGSADSAHSLLIAGNCPHLLTVWKGTALSR